MPEGNSHCSGVKKSMERRKCCFRFIGQEMTLKGSFVGFTIEEEVAKHVERERIF